MSAKQCHRLRTLQRERDYAKAMVAWLERKPSAIHFRPAFYLEAAGAEKN